jgi:hypothetical protein
MMASATAMSLSASDPPFVVGNPGSRRVELFQAALGGWGFAPAHVVAYADILSGRAHLASAVPPGAVNSITLISGPRTPGVTSPK